MVPRNVATMIEYVVYSGCALDDSRGEAQASPPTPAATTPASAGDGAPSPPHTSSRNIAGTSSAVSFSQYWKACTNVMLRMPPQNTLTRTTAPTSSPPTHGGVPATVPSERPAPWNCGMRYSQPTATTSREEVPRTDRDSSRASAKSGSVYAPERRSGAATSTSSTRYPAVHPTGYHSMSVP